VPLLPPGVPQPLGLAAAQTGQPPLESSSIVYTSAAAALAFAALLFGACARHRRDPKAGERIERLRACKPAAAAVPSMRRLSLKFKMCGPCSVVPAATVAAMPVAHADGERMSLSQSAAAEESQSSLEVDAISEADVHTALKDVLAQSRSAGTPARVRADRPGLVHAKL